MTTLPGLAQNCYENEECSVSNIFDRFFEVAADCRYLGLKYGAGFRFPLDVLTI